MWYLRTPGLALRSVNLAYKMHIRVNKIKGFFVCCLCLQVMCRYRNVWNIELKLCPAFLGGIMQGSGTQIIRSSLMK